MAMGSGGTRGSSAEINVTPLIDVLLVLLIIFMVMVPTLPIGLRSAVPQPAKGPTERSEPPVRLEVQPAAPGALEASYRVDGQPVAAAELGSELRARLFRRQEHTLLVSGDRSLSYDQVAQAISVAKAAGASPIGIVTPAGEAAAR